jgi:hypothetical protein
VVASNAFGTSQGRDHAFTVPVLALAATTGNAMPTGLDSARLTGSVNPNATTISDCHFDYGTSSAYGFSIPCAQQVGRGNDVISVSADVAGLAANTIYHFRLVAANTAGTSAGSDQTYTTPKHVGPPTLAPVLSGLTVTPARFHPAGPGLTVRAVRPTSSGTIIRYRDTLAATTTLTVLRAVTGVRAGRRCVAQHGRSANRTKHCVLLLAVTRFTHVDRAGVNGFRFAGRVAGKALVAGRYTLQASATDAGLTSRPVSARFQILR